MSPLYESELITRDDLDEKRKRHTCAECNGRLAIFYDTDKHLTFLACSDWHRSGHEGISRETTKYEQQGMQGMTIEARREFMEKQIGEEKTRALTKYSDSRQLTKVQAMEIMEAIWPGAPQVEKTRASLLCVSYNLNPLMKHIFLIPFNKGAKNETWATVMGIGATRLLASRKGTFSYVDDTPRIMTEEEQVKRFGESYPERLYVIVKVKDPKTGAEAPGYGWWPKSVKAYGEEKGNTIFNMAAIRAERQALSRLRPGEMPTDVEVMEESMAEAASEKGFDIESTGREVDGITGEIIEGEVKSTEDVIPPSEPEPAPEPIKAAPAPKEKDETAATKADVDLIKKLAKEAGLTLTELGGRMTKDLKWYPCPGALSELKKWQVGELSAYLNKAAGKAQG